MEKIAFIGSYDKADLIIYIAKILNLLGKKVLVIDSTTLQKTRYIVPKMKPAKCYITSFEGIDIAVGFESLEQIKQYCDLKEGANFDYDFALANIDSYKGYCNFGLKTEDKTFFITSFDMYCLRRGLQVFKKMPNRIKVQKILFSKDMLPEEDEYLNYLSKDLNIEWAEEVVFFPLEQGDQTALFINQRAERIQLRGLSRQYIEGLEYIVEVMGIAKQCEIKKAIKILERN